MLFNFEKPTTPVSNPGTSNEKNGGLQGMCERCEGEGRVRPGFLKAKKVCGDCHGKGFIKEEDQPTEKAYSWDTGLKH